MVCVIADKECVDNSSQTVVIINDEEKDRGDQMTKVNF